MGDVVKAQQDQGSGCHEVCFSPLLLPPFAALLPMEGCMQSQQFRLADQSKVSFQPCRRTSLCAPVPEQCLHHYCGFVSGPHSTCWNSNVSPGPHRLKTEGGRRAGVTLGSMDSMVIRTNGGQPKQQAAKHPLRPVSFLELS